MARLMVSLLGPFQVLLDGQAIRGLHSATLRGLLSFLVVESEREHTRRHLADLLWPEQPDQVASSNLRYTLSDLRYAIGDLIRNTPSQPRTHSPSPFLRDA
jgi:DNA-binding SARP family transcriptional activator